MVVDIAHAQSAYQFLKFLSLPLGRYNTLLVSAVVELDL